MAHPFDVRSQLQPLDNRIEWHIALVCLYDAKKEVVRRPESAVSVPPIIFGSVVGQRQAAAVGGGV
jgi:hypothetical protein